LDEENRYLSGRLYVPLCFGLNGAHFRVCVLRGQPAASWPIPDRNPRYLVSSGITVVWYIESVESEIRCPFSDQPDRCMASLTSFLCAPLVSWHGRGVVAVSDCLRAGRGASRERRGRAQAQANRKLRTSLPPRALNEGSSAWERIPPDFPTETARNLS